MKEIVKNYRVELLTYQKTTMFIYVRLISNNDISKKEMISLFHRLANNHTSKVKSSAEITNQEFEEQSWSYEFFYDNLFQPISLKVCPFCGKRPKITVRDTHYALVCVNCRFALRDLSLIQLRHRWNNRFCGNVCETLNDRKE